MLNNPPTAGRQLQTWAGHAGPLRLDPLSPALWYRELARFPQAGFSHTPAWARLIRQVWGGETQTVLHPTPSGGSVLLPLIRRRLARGLIPWSISGETGVYGGPLTDERLSITEWRLLWALLPASFGSMTVFLPPGMPWEAPADGQVILHETHRLALDDGPPRQRYNRGLKAKLNRALRQELTVREGTDLAAVDAYWSLYEQTLARWGDRTSWVRPRAFFDALLAHGHPDVRLYLAYQGERVVAGVWISHFGAEACYLAGATAADALELGGSHLLIDHAIGQAAANGQRWFDLGASGGRAGLIHFKSGFGAQPVSYPEIRLWAPPMRLYWWLKSRRTPVPAQEETTC